MSMARSTLGTLANISPLLAAYVGCHVLAKPPLVAELPWQAALRQRASLAVLRVGGKKIALFEWGKTDRPSILMVHGWGARATQMGSMITPLVDAGFRVISFDAPAHGHSTGTTSNIKDFAGAAAAVANFAGPLHATISHSFGAASAMLAARDCGVFAERHILISAFAHYKWVLNAFGRHAELPGCVIDRMQQMIAQRLGYRPDWSQLSVVEMLRATDRPALLVHDEQDPEIPFEHSVALLRGAPKANLLVTRGFGHHRLLGHKAVIEGALKFVSAGSPASS
jgi:pimeloyl-ACP methyl ester carboxylesterase